MENTLKHIQRKDYIETFIKTAFTNFKQNWKVLILGFIVLYAIIFGAQFLLERFGLIGLIGHQLVALFMSLGITRLFLDSYDDNKPSVKKMFTKTTAREFLVMVGLMILSIVLFIGLMFIVPIMSIGLLMLTQPWVFALILIPVMALLVIISMGLSFYVFAIIDQKKGVFSSLAYSWKITKGYRANMFMLSLVSLLILIAGILALGVGVLVALPIISLIQAHMYRDMAGKNTAIQNDDVVEVVKDNQAVLNENKEEVIEA